MIINRDLLLTKNRKVDKKQNHNQLKLNNIIKELFLTLYKLLLIILSQKYFGYENIRLQVIKEKQ